MTSPSQVQTPTPQANTVHDQLERPNFSHPAEEAFATILDFYGVEWKYEPCTFPLEWDEQGNVTLAFSPDFYLPGQDLYIELTTLRPKLTRKKNHKMRQMKALYPDVNVKLFKRKEMRDLMSKFGLDEQAAQITGTKAQNPHP
jgi:hypothetical protein